MLATISRTEKTKVLYAWKCIQCGCIWNEIGGTWESNISKAIARKEK